MGDARYARWKVGGTAAGEREGGAKGVLGGSAREVTWPGPPGIRTKKGQFGVQRGDMTITKKRGVLTSYESESYMRVGL